MIHMQRVLFVCTGNICRSPTAAGVLRKLVQDAGLAHSIEVDSAGTHDYHIGAAPDPRARRAARVRGYDLTSLRARQVVLADFERFDLLLAMDEAHRAILARMSLPATRHKVRMFLSYATGTHGYSEVPDPYYGTDHGFELVLDLIEDAARGLLAELQRAKAGQSGLA